MLNTEYERVMNAYADNAATTKVSQFAINAMLPCLTETYGIHRASTTLARPLIESESAQPHR